MKAELLFKVNWLLERKDLSRKCSAWKDFKLSLWFLHPPPLRKSTRIFKATSKAKKITTLILLQIFTISKHNNIAKGVGNLYNILNVFFKVTFFLNDKTLWQVWPSSPQPGLISCNFFNPLLQFWKFLLKSDNLWKIAEWVPGSGTRRRYVN